MLGQLLGTREKPKDRRGKKELAPSYLLVIPVSVTSLALPSDSRNSSIFRILLPFSESTSLILRCEHKLSSPSLRALGLSLGWIPEIPPSGFQVLIIPTISLCRMGKPRFSGCFLRLLYLCHFKFPFCLASPLIPNQYLTSNSLTSNWLTNFLY